MYLYVHKTGRTVRNFSSNKLWAGRWKVQNKGKILNFSKQSIAVVGSFIVNIGMYLIGCLWSNHVMYVEGLEAHRSWCNFSSKCQMQEMLSIQC